MSYSQSNYGQHVDSRVTAQKGESRSSFKSESAAVIRFGIAHPSLWLIEMSALDIFSIECYGVHFYTSVSL